MNILRMSFLADAPTTFVFGAHEAPRILAGWHWLALLPSLGAMVLTALGHLRPRDLLAIFSLPAFAAACWGVSAFIRQDAGLHYALLGVGSSHINVAMLLIAFMLFVYAVAWALSRSTALPFARRIAGYVFVWALCASNLPLIYKFYAGPNLLAMEYNSLGLALGWIAGIQASLFAICLIPPSLAGALRSRVSTGCQQAATWIATGIYGAAVVLAVLKLSPSL